MYFPFSAFGRTISATAFLLSWSGDFCIYVCINNYEKYCSVLNNNAYSEPGNNKEFSILKRFIEKVCEIYSMQLKEDIENNVMTITPAIDVEVLLTDLLNQFVNEHNLLSLNLLTVFVVTLVQLLQSCCHLKSMQVVHY